MLRHTFITLALAALAACSSTTARAPARHAPAPALAPPASTANAPASADARDTRAPSALTRLHALAPELDPGVLALALEARDCAIRNGTGASGRLAVIDYTRASTQPRLWVFDVERARLLYREHVAHGRGTGGNFARAFSNRDGSHQSSLGLFSTAETYTGGNGYSLRLDGLDAGINDAARERLIVMHGASYVDPAQAARQGRLGRSFGCPAVRPQIAREVIDTLKGGQLLFAYFPDDRWLGSSRHFGCGGRTVAQIVADARVLDSRGAALGTEATATR